MVAILLNIQSPRPRRILEYAHASDVINGDALPSCYVYILGLSMLLGQRSSEIEAGSIAFHMSSGSILHDRKSVVRVHQKK